MGERTCSIEGCVKARYCRGWCTLHYSRWQEHGDPHWEPPTLEERFWAKVDIRGPDECWLWTAYCDSNTYGRFNLGGGRVEWAHRVAYELAIGPIPDGLSLDHLCRTPPCVNPQHLDPCSIVENGCHGNSPWQVNRRKTHCKRGHEFTPENTYTDKDGWRSCRRCHADYERDRKRRLAGES